MISAKVIFRTIGYLLFSRPYFAHLCITHQCNLRCHYCRAWQIKFDHLSLDQWKYIIDLLDKLGIAILSITGGEPLLHPDVYSIIEYGKHRGLYVRLTSNGTLSQSRYDRLLDTNIDAITLSLDGVRGNDLPNSKISPKILDMVKYIYNKTRKGPIHFSLSMVMSENNSELIAENLSTIQAEFPGLMVFVQPIVSGKGMFRCEDTKSVDIPHWLSNYSNVLNPAYFNAFCEEMQHGKKWVCQAGKLFFDIKPDGKFYICQDFATSLSTLDEGFIQEWQRHDFSEIRSECIGCTYSCYVLTQEGRKFKALLNSAYSFLNYHFH